MQINPEQIVDAGVVKLSPTSAVQQVGIDLSLKDSISIQHGHSLNVAFNETIELPETLFGLFYVRSSFSRKGVFVSTGVWDPGYSGSLGCTIYNLSGDTIGIEKGERIGQLICFEAQAAGSYQGQWQGK